MGSLLLEESGGWTRNFLVNSIPTDPEQLTMAGPLTGQSSTKIFSSTVTIVALFVFQSLALSSTNVTAPPDVYCDRHTEPFVTPRFNPSDCDLAIRYLESNISDAGSTEYEFRAPFAAAHYPDTGVRTPKCFTYDTCTIAVAMLVLFDPTALKVWSDLPRDLSDWGSVLAKATDVSDTCLDHFRPPRNDAEGADLTKRAGSKDTVAEGAQNFVNPWGYSVVGREKAVGVFVWDSWSIINHAMCKKDLNPDLAEGNGTLVINGSTIASPDNAANADTE